MTDLACLRSESDTLSFRNNVWPFHLKIQSFVVWHNTLCPFTYTPACVKLRQQWGFWNSLLTLAECFTLWQKADACCQPNSSLRNRSSVSDKMLKLVGKSHSLVSDKCFAILELWFVIFSNLFTPVHLYYRPQIKRIHVFKRIFRSDISRENQNAANLERFRKILSSHVLLSSFSLCSNRTNPEAQVYRVFNHANWPIKMQHSHWLCSNHEIAFRMIMEAWHYGGQNKLPRGQPSISTTEKLIDVTLSWLCSERIQTKVKRHPYFACFLVLFITWLSFPHFRHVRGTDSCIFIWLDHGNMFNKELL